MLIEGSITGGTRDKNHFGVHQNHLAPLLVDLQGHLVLLLVFGDAFIDHYVVPKSPPLLAVIVVCPVIWLAIVRVKLGSITSFFSTQT